MNMAASSAASISSAPEEPPEGFVEHRPGQDAEFEWTWLDIAYLNDDPLADEAEEALRLQVMAHANDEKHALEKVLEMQTSYGLRWLAVHRIDLVDASDWKYSCQYCRKEFIGITQLRDHIESNYHKRWKERTDGEEKRPPLFIMKNVNR